MLDLQRIPFVIGAFLANLYTLKENSVLENLASFKKIAYREYRWLQKGTVISIMQVKLCFTNSVSTLSYNYEVSKDVLNGFDKNV